MIESLGPYVTPVVLIAGLSGWLWRLHGQANENFRTLSRIERALNKCFERVDAIQEEQAVMKRQLATITTLTSPDVLKEHWVNSTRMEMRMETAERRIERLADQARLT